MLNYFINIFNYESWANKKISECLVKISGSNDKAVSLMSHIINAQIIWLCRIRNEITNVKVWEEYERSSIGIKLIESSDNLNIYLNSKKESDLSCIISYTNTKDEKYSSGLSDILIHLSHHSAYHRGQIISFIKPMSAELPYTDYIHYIRNLK